jgi:ribose 5-phosphate isomerase B
MERLIAIGSDHAGFCLKEIIKTSLEKEGFKFRDYGTGSEDSVDYPDFIHPLAKSVNDGKLEFGIIICGSGNGVAMVANKYLRVRAAVCWNEEITKLARLHNDANIIALPARFLGDEEAIKFVRLFLDTSFEGGRHETRVKKISAII